MNIQQVLRKDEIDVTNPMHTKAQFSFADKVGGWHAEGSQIGGRLAVCL